MGNLFILNRPTQPPRADPHQHERELRAHGERGREHRPAHREHRQAAVRGVRQDIRDQGADGEEEVVQQDLIFILIVELLVI